MEQATPPPPTTQVNCQWCTKPMDSTAVRCNSCGKLRKDIYSDKIKCYTLCILGGLLIGISFTLKKNNRGYYDYYASSSGNSTSTILLVVGILSAIVGLYFYYKVSQQLKTYWWS